MKLPTLQYRSENDVVVVAIEPGFDIDITNAGELATTLLQNIPSSSRGMVIDLRNVQYVDSAGIRLLFGVARQLNLSRQQLGMVLSDRSPIRRLLSITALDQVACVGSDEAACIAGVRAVR